MDSERRLISSLDKARLAVLGSDPSVNITFVLRDNCPLNEARDLWRAMRHGPGGDARLANPDILVYKESAYHLVQQKLRQLRRRITNLSKLLDAVDMSIAKLQETLTDGGPGVPVGYETRTFRGPAAYVDVREMVGDEDLAAHGAEMTALILEVSPGSPAQGEEAELTLREAEEQRVMCQFNIAYLRVKRRALRADRDELQEGLEALEEEFLTLPTLLGRSSGDFVRFVDHSTYAGESRGL